MARSTPGVVAEITSGRVVIIGIVIASITVITSILDITIIILLPLLQRLLALD